MPNTRARLPLGFNIRIVQLDPGAPTPMDLVINALLVEEQGGLKTRVPTGPILYPWQENELSLIYREPGQPLVMSKRHGVTVLLLIGGLASLRPLRTISESVLTLWTFTYDYGFIKRALVGEVVARTFGVPSATLITILSGVLALALAAALLRWFAEPALRDGSLGVWLFALVAVSHSATLSNVVYDLGRFDHIGYFLVLGCLTVLAHGSHSLRLGVVPVACVIGLLVHEAFALMFVPLVLAVWEYEEDRTGREIRVILLTGLVATTWAIGTFGLMTALPMDEYIRHLNSLHPFAVVEGSVFVLYTDLGQNVRGTLTTIRDIWYLANHLGMVLLLLPSFILLRRLARAVAAKERASGGRVKLVVLAALTPLLLYPLGWDLSRWWAIALTNLFIALSYLAVREGSIRAIGKAIEGSPVVVGAVLCVSLVAGPLGVVQPFPCFEGFWFLGYRLFYGIAAWLGF